MKIDEFIKQLNNIFKQHNYKRQGNNYYYTNRHVSLIFNVQKSRYSRQYYFNVYYRAFKEGEKLSEVREEADYGGRLEDFYPEDFDIIMRVNFDENCEEEIAQFLLHAEKYAGELKALTHPDKYSKLSSANNR